MIKKVSVYLILILLLSLMVGVKFTGSQIQSNISNLKNITNRKKSVLGLNLTPMNPISINGDNELINYASSNSLSGNGLINSPYLFNGMSFVGNGSNVLLSIESTTLYVKIDSNSFSLGKIGLSITNSSNIIISNNEFNNNTQDGVDLYITNNVNITRNGFITTGLGPQSLYCESFNTIYMTNNFFETGFVTFQTGSNALISNNTFVISEFGFVTISNAIIKYNNFIDVDYPYGNGGIYTLTFQNVTLSYNYYETWAKVTPDSNSDNILDKPFPDPSTNLVDNTPLATYVKSSRSWPYISIPSITSESSINGSIDIIWFPSIDLSQGNVSYNFYLVTDQLYTIGQDLTGTALNLTIFVPSQFYLYDKAPFIIDIEAVSTSGIYNWFNSTSYPYHTMTFASNQNPSNPTNSTQPTPNSSKSAGSFLDFGTNAFILSLGIVALVRKKSIKH